MASDLRLGAIEDNFKKCVDVFWGGGEVVEVEKKNKQMSEEDYIGRKPELRFI
jgi:hypothetical protein